MDYLTRTVRRMRNQQSDRDQDAAERRGAGLAAASVVVAAIQSSPVPAGQSTDRTSARTGGRLARTGVAVLLVLVAVMLAAVIIAPIALSSQDIIDWAHSPNGLGLTDGWAVTTFLALDAAAAVCVGLVVYCMWRGEKPGIFGWLVWAFAATSAFANYRHGIRPGAPADAAWFFPAMSLAGPFLLEVLTRRVRRWIQEGAGRRSAHGVSYGLALWVPGVGALRETYCSWRLARLVGLDDAGQSRRLYRLLCPDGSMRVLARLREAEALVPASPAQSAPSVPSVQDCDDEPVPAVQSRPASPVQRTARPARTADRGGLRAVPINPPHEVMVAEIVRRFGTAPPGREKVAAATGWNDRGAIQKAINAVKAQTDTKEQSA